MLGLTAPVSFFFDATKQAALDFLSSGFQPRTRWLYVRQWRRSLRISRLADAWNDLGSAHRDYAIAHYFVGGRSRERDEADAVSKTQAGYLLSHLKYKHPEVQFFFARKVSAMRRGPSPKIW